MSYDNKFTSSFIARGKRFRIRRIILISCGAICICFVLFYSIYPLHSNLRPHTGTFPSFVIMEKPPLLTNIPMSPVMDSSVNSQFKPGRSVFPNIGKQKPVIQRRMSLPLPAEISGKPLKSTLSLSIPNTPHGESLKPTKYDESLKPNIKRGNQFSQNTIENIPEQSNYTYKKYALMK